MARKKIVRTRTAQIRPEANPRHLWLAGLGMIALAGREGKTAVADVAQRAARARKQAIAAVGLVQSSVLSTVADLRSQIETGAGEIVGKLEAGVQPLIAKFKPTKAKRVVRRGRKPVAKAKSLAKGARRNAKKAPTKRTRKA
jgi:hypothetical protein